MIFSLFFVYKLLKKIKKRYLVKLLWCRLFSLLFTDEPIYSEIICSFAFFFFLELLLREVPCKSETKYSSGFFVTCKPQNKRWSKAFIHLWCLDVPILELWHISLWSLFCYCVDSKEGCIDSTQYCWFFFVRLVFSD